MGLPYGCHVLAHVMAHGRDVVGNLKLEIGRLTEALGAARRGELLMQQHVVYLRGQISYGRERIVNLRWRTPD